jgi:hypothetical protein
MRTIKRQQNLDPLAVSTVLLAVSLYARPRQMTAQASRSRTAELWEALRLQNCAIPTGLFRIVRNERLLQPSAQLK